MLNPYNPHNRTRDQILLLSSICQIRKPRHKDFKELAHGYLGAGPELDSTASLPEGADPLLPLSIGDEPEQGGERRDWLAFWPLPQC